MKKAISLLLALIIALSLCGFAKNEEEKPDDFTIEDFKIIEKNSKKLDCKVKVRNNTDADCSELIIFYQYLDEYGNSLNSGVFGGFNLLALQSNWIDGYSRDEEALNDAAAIRFVSYRADNEKEKQFSAQNVEYSLIAAQTSISSGDVIESDTLQIELTGISFADSVFADGKERVPETNGVIFGMLHMRIKNVAKESINLAKALNVKIDYNDGFIFSTTNATCYLTFPDNPESYVRFKKSENGASSMQYADYEELPPLATVDCILSIPCAEELADADADLLKVIFTQFVDGESRDFIYDVSGMVVDSTTSADTADPVTIEKTFIKKRQSDSFYIAFNVRNCGNEAKEIIEVTVQFLDQSGDVLTSADVSAFNLEAEQGGKTEYRLVKCALEDVVSIKVISYRYGIGTELVRHFENSPTKMNTPVVISIEEATIE